MAIIIKNGEKNDDYNATLQTFFNEVIKYLEKLQKKAPDQITSDRTMAAIDMVCRMAKNPKKFASYEVRCKEGMENGDIAEAFIPVGTNDNRVYLYFYAVVNSMDKLNSPCDMERKLAQDKLLNALKTLKYRNSTNLLKDFTFAFKAPKSFAIKCENNR